MYAVYDAVSRSDGLQWVMTAKVCVCVCVCVCICLSSPSNQSLYWWNCWLCDEYTCTCRWSWVAWWWKGVTDKHQLHVKTSPRSPAIRYILPVNGRVHVSYMYMYAFLLKSLASLIFFFFDFWKVVSDFWLRSSFVGTQVCTWYDRFIF